MSEPNPPATVHHLTHRMRESAKRIRKHREQMAQVAQQARDELDTENGKEATQQ